MVVSFKSLGLSALPSSKVSMLLTAELAMCPHATMLRRAKRCSSFGRTIRQASVRLI